MTTPVTDRDVKWVEIRRRRNAILQSSDWTQMLDSPEDELGKQRWATYRQNLRDLPQNYDDPDLVVWPAPPR